MLIDLLQAQQDADGLLAAMRPKPCRTCMLFGITTCLARRPRGPFARLVAAQIHADDLADRRAAAVFRTLVCPVHGEIDLVTPCTPENCRYLDHGTSAP